TIFSRDWSSDVCSSDLALWPLLARQNVLAGAEGPPMTQRMVAAFLGVLALLPLFYGLAALSRLVARAFGGRGSFFAARIVLFWRSEERRVGKAGRRRGR